MKVTFNKHTRKTFWFNLLMVIVVATILYMLFFLSLSFITHHGEEVKMPDVVGTDMQTSLKKLQGMTFEVIVDSAYELNEKPFIVLRQIPDSGSSVKKGRTVFITVNKSIPPMTPMPNLVSLSYRIAERILKNNKLEMGDTTYKPDIAQGAVLTQLFNGKEVKPGEMVPEGSKINLVLGDGLGNTEFNVPDVVGMPYSEGVAYIMGMNLQYVKIEGSDSDIIVKQTPAAVNELGAPNRIKQGDVIDLWTSPNPPPEMNNRNSNKPVNSGEGH
jgi:beta-lactam-binding protein with PASTA domain